MATAASALPDEHDDGVGRIPMDGHSGNKNSLPLEEVDFKTFKATGAIVRCPLTVQ
jgi:hypothetical protein